MLMAIDDHRLEITKGNKILFPETGISKKDLLEYYDAIADRILPYLKNRPLTMQRFPKGIGKDGFFQKNASDYFPHWIETVKVRKTGGWLNQVLCNNKDTLLYLVNQYVVTFHVTLSRMDRPDHPDKLIFDLDPPKGKFQLAVKAANALRIIMEDQLGMRSFVMTSGSKGLHVAVPLKRDNHFSEVRDFAGKVSGLLAANHPEEFTTAIRKDKRGERLYLDYLRNSYGQTSVAPFSVRAVEHAPVATPLDWSDLSDPNLGPRSFDIHSIVERVAHQENPWKEFHNVGKDISSARKKLDLLLEHA